MKNFLALFGVLFCLVMVSSCSEDDEPGAVTVTSITPDFGFAGEVVTISGSGFSTNAEDNQVYFHNGKKATVLQASATELQVEIPAGSTKGVITIQQNGGQKMVTESFNVHEVIDIQQVRDAYVVDGENTFNDLYYIEGVVTSNGDNLADNEFFIQDADAGILVALEGTNTYVQGTKLRIRLSEAVQTQDGLNTLTEVSAAEIESFGATELPAPVEATIAELLDGDYEAQRVVLKNVTYSGSTSLFEGKITIEDAEGDEINAWVDESSALYHVALPSGSGDIIGIGSMGGDPLERSLHLNSSEEAAW